MKKSFILTLMLLVPLLLIAGCTTTEPDPITESDTDTTDVIETDPEEVMEAAYMDISPEDASTLIADTPDIIIIDVSPLYADGHLPNAINYYVGDGSLDEAIPALDMKATYLVYCHTDAASIAGADALITAGFTNVYRLEGNFGAWVDAGFEVEI